MASISVFINVSATSGRPAMLLECGNDLYEDCLSILKQYQFFVVVKEFAKERGGRSCRMGTGYVTAGEQIAGAFSETVGVLKI